MIMIKDGLDRGVFHNISTDDCREAQSRNLPVESNLL